MNSEMFAKALIRERERRGWTRKKMCERSGYPYSTLAQWETERREPTDYTKIDVLKKIYALEPGAIKRKVRG